ncbi:MAG: NAD-dependent epimerase/dehydratase family protein, partial [Dehalococcoidia bacterium]|nr:NAD-dependent epimerase/dehydratase family protein [Dehalococcoidia bacterium]
GEPVYQPCDEEHPVRPLCPYGASKHAVEHYLYLYGQLYGLDYTVLRYPNIYGPRQDPHGEAGVIAIFTQRMLAGAEAAINGSGEQERDFLYVGDAAEANLLALHKGSGDIYNLGWGHGVTINRIFDLLKEMTGYTGEAIYAPAVPEVFKICLEAARAREQLGWEPRVPLEEGLRRTVEYFKGQSRQSIG